MGFRIGVGNQDYRSDWFADFSSYSRFVKEDFLIRSFFGPSFYDRFERWGVLSVRISRKASYPDNLLEVIVHAIDPGALVRTRSGMEDLFQYLVRNKVQLTKFVSKDQRLRIVVKKELEKKGHSVLISRRICDQFERRLRLGTVVGWVKREMRGLKLVGYKVLLSGRVGGRERARAVCLRDGRVCLHTIRADVDYAVSVARTRYGSLGVKVWICRGGLGIQKG